MAARLCLDCGLNKLKENPDDELLNTKKSWFWFTYILDKAFSLSLGRSPNFSDYDITIAYPDLPSTPTYEIIVIWFDCAKIQGKVYEQLYSAQGKLQDVETKTQVARRLATEFLDLRRRCQVCPRPYLNRFIFLIQI